MPETGIQNCPVCKTENPDNARFCINCGAGMGGTLKITKANTDELGLKEAGKPLAAANVSYDPGTVVLNRYRVERELGRGGMGTVLLCRDMQNDEEPCCLKVINPQLIDNEDLVERFKSEGRIARKIRHPGIIATHDIFEWNKRWHIAMEFFPGTVLRKLITESDNAGTPIAMEMAVAILTRMLDALEAAHQVTVHRDIKPENVMFYGDFKSPDFQVKILDFGIAKNFEVSNATMTEVAMGTTGYMAPEQAKDAARVDARADLYACAVIFYEMLTGLLPVGSYDPPSVLRPELPSWVDGFTDRGLKYRADARYTSAADMRTALLNAGQTRQESQSQSQPQAAPVFAAVDSAMDGKRGRWLRVKLMDSKQGRLHSVAFSPDGQNFATAGDDGSTQIWDARRLKRVVSLGGHSQWVKSVHYSPNGKLLATGSGDNTVRIWDTRNWRELNVIRGHEQPVIAVRFSPDGNFLASSGADQLAILWDAATFEPVAEVRGGGIAALSFSPDGLLLASGTLNQSVVVWDLMRGETLVELKGHRGTITSLAFSPEGRYLLTGSDDTTIRVYELPGFERTLKVRNHSSLIWSIAFSSDGKLVASAGEDKILVLRSLPDWEEVATFSDHPKGVSGVAFSPDGKMMATCGREGGVAVYALQV
ncbi:MAG: protein kinase [Planctomycetaceae bacterium]|nr:hypothetical protein [Planctomycetota bacterium]NUO15903.1 protein kinase [Planctomycetaceae bacterium]GIK51745.1 MAG: hypothetical protein BroJett014_07180 [Planctomycetota bacterium]